MHEQLRQGQGNAVTSSFALIRTCTWLLDNQGPWRQITPQKQPTLLETKPPCNPQHLAAAVPYPCKSGCMKGRRGKGSTVVASTSRAVDQWLRVVCVGLALAVAVFCDEWLIHAVHTCALMLYTCKLGERGRERETKPRRKKKRAVTR